MAAIDPVEVEVAFSDQRLRELRAGMVSSGLDVVVAVHDGTHFIDSQNPVMVLAGFKSLGPAVVVVGRSEIPELIVTPAWDAERAAEACPGWRVTPARDVVAAVRAATTGAASVGIAGLSQAAHALAAALAEALPDARKADDVVFDTTWTKTADEIARAREATRIAELGLQHLLDIARPGITEDELAFELRWHSKSLGADDNFILVCASPRNSAVQPSTGRKLQDGDLLLAEITPSYQGQLAQICRTVSIGAPGEVLANRYALLCRAMNEGIRAARPGVPMADVCRAINRLLEAEGYAEFCHPPHIRRRGHGLGFGSLRPGDVSLDNDVVLRPDMLFMIHPNQYLPETGYLLCGEPVLITERGAEPLTVRQSALEVVA